MVIGIGQDENGIYVDRTRPWVDCAIGFLVGAGVFQVASDLWNIVHRFI